MGDGFLEAGQNPLEMSVSPFGIFGVSEGGDDEEEGDLGDFKAVAAEKLCVEKEEDFLREIVDPKLPTQGEIDKHFRMGHLPFRNWCTICCQARGRELDHKKDSGKERKLPAYSFDYCFLEMNWDLNGQFW